MSEILGPLQLLSSDPEDAEAACATLCGAGWPCQVLRDASDCAQAPHCHWLEQLPAQQVHMRAALDDAIATLEKTRHAFKSTNLGELRRRLQRLREEL